MSASYAVEREEVYEAELDKIKARRESAGISFDNSPRGSCVGLALSGGGVRSSAFSLGVFQGLCEKNLLRSVDYLSTVSGGGYAGGFLSSFAVAAPAESAPAKGKKPNRHEQLVELLAGREDGRQSRRMMAFIQGGHYLNRSLRFFNRYSIGTLLNLAFVLSVLIAVASGVSQLFRCLDEPTISLAIGILGFRTDISRALFPGIALLILWLFCWFMSALAIGFASLLRTASTTKIFRFVSVMLRFLHRPKLWVRFGVGKASIFDTLTEWVLLSSIVSLAIGFAMLLGTGDIDVSAFLHTEQPASGQASVWAHVQNLLKTLIFSAIGASLLPYFKPTMLIRSGVAPTGTLDKMLYWAASRSLVFGLPFLLVAFFAREHFPLA